MGNCCSAVLSFFPRDDLDEILYLIESVSEGFPTYPYILMLAYGNVTTSFRLIT